MDDRDSSGVGKETMNGIATDFVTTTKSNARKGEERSVLKCVGACVTDCLLIYSPGMLEE